MQVGDRPNSSRVRRTLPVSDAKFSPVHGAIPAAAASVTGGPSSAEVAERPAAPRHARIARTVAPLLLGIVFWIHLLSPAGVAVPALYVAPILLFIRTGRFWEPLLVALVATAATVAGAFQSHAIGIEIDRLNLPLELAIIWLSALPVAYHRVMSERWTDRVARKQSALEQTIVRLEELRYALDQAAIVAATDHRGVITYVNDKFCEISKYSREELLGRDHRIINSGFHSREFMSGLWQTIGRGQVWRGEIRNRAKDGIFYWVDTTIVPFLDDRGKPRQYLAIRGDITKRKAAEAKLVQQAALTQLGQLGAMVAHEVRNPLAGLRGTLEVLQPRLAATSKERDVFQAMIERIDALNAKVNDILRFARPQPAALQALELDPIIEDAVASACASLVRERPEITFRGHSARVQADPEMLRGVLINLLLNACQAGSSRVGIRTFSEGAVCRIAIDDDGCGIPADAREQLFEAFYTTKKTGTGLGLPIVKRFMELQEGAVSLKPREGGGTVAEITLPLAS